jgi:outer membrane protein insertion porin family
MLFEGNAHYSDGRLKDLIRTRTPSLWWPFRDTPYRADIVSEDIERIQRFYWQEGYLQARVWLIEAKQLKDKRKFEIKIGIQEGEMTLVESVVYRNHHVVTEKELDEVVETEPGKSFSASRVRLDRERIAILYADRGRPYSAVADSVKIDSLKAWVTFYIQEAPPTLVRNITIEGNRNSKKFVIRRELTFERGDLMERTEVAESRENLFETGLFRNVRFESANADSMNNPPSQVDVTVLVVERDMRWALAGVGYSSSKQVRLSGELGHRNIFGNAHRLVFRSRVAFDVDALIDQDQPALEETRSELVFAEPRLLSTRILGTITLFAESSREPEVLAEGVEREDNWGINLAAERRLRGRSRVRAALEQQWVDQRRRVEQIMGPDTVLVTEEQHFATRSVSFFGERDRRDNPFDPVTGTLGTFLGELTGGALGGTSNYWKINLSGSWYHRVHGMVIATRLLGGWIHPFNFPEAERPIDQVPRSDRFRAGGAITVRGYPEDSLGPQAITPGQKDPATDRGLATVVGNVELRFPMPWLFSGAVFVDMGNVWEEPKDVTLARFVPQWNDAEIEDVRYTTGGGLRVRTPVGPLRVDYGYSLVRGEPEEVIEATGGGEWHFSLGQAF